MGLEDDVFSSFSDPLLNFPESYGQGKCGALPFALLAEVERIRFLSPGIGADLEGMMGFGAYKDGPPIYQL